MQVLYDGGAVRNAELYNTVIWLLLMAYSYASRARLSRLPLMVLCGIQILFKRLQNAYWPRLGLTPARRPSVVVAVGLIVAVSS